MAISVCNISIPEKVWFGTDTISQQLAVKGQRSRTHGAQTNIYPINPHTPNFLDKNSPAFRKLHNVIDNHFKALRKDGNGSESKHIQRSLQRKKKTVSGKVEFWAWLPLPRLYWEQFSSIMAKVFVWEEGVSIDVWSCHNSLAAQNLRITTSTQKMLPRIDREALLNCNWRTKRCQFIRMNQQEIGATSAFWTSTLASFLKKPK